MNVVESVAVLERLREGIITYFDHIIPLLRIREQGFLPVPFPDDPTGLPADFPHGDCFHAFPIQWTDTEQVRHDFRVKLLHLPPEPGEQHVKWKLLFKRRYWPEPGTQIGLLLVDRALVEDQNFYRIDGPLVLGLLGLAVFSGEPVHLRKITLTVAPTVQEVVQMVHGFYSIELAKRVS